MFEKGAGRALIYLKCCVLIAVTPPKMVLYGNWYFIVFTATDMCFGLVVSQIYRFLNI